MRLIFLLIVAGLACAGCRPAVSADGMRPAAARAAEVFRDLQVCDAAGCDRPEPIDIDPQGRLVRITAKVTKPDFEPVALHIAATASSEVYLNGVLAGRNGAPGSSRASEVAGRYDASFYLAPELWREGDNDLEIRMSSFRAPFPLRRPVYLWLAHLNPPPGRPSFHEPLAFLGCGALLAGLAYFGALFIARRSRSSLILSGLALTALLRAGVEAWREYWPYLYPVHPWRLVIGLALSWLFGLFLTALMAERYGARGYRLVLVAAGAGLVLSVLGLGFDARNFIVLLSGIIVASLPVIGAVRRKTPGAAWSLAYLGLFLAALLIVPQFFLDFYLFVAAALLVLFLLVAEVVRIRHEDRAREAELRAAAGGPERLAVSTGKGVELVLFDDIVSLRGADDYAELHLSDGRRLLHAATLDFLLANLPDSFFRTHRSAIANLAKAQRLTREAGGWRVELAGGEVLPVSRRRLAALRARLAV